MMFGFVAIKKKKKGYTSASSQKAGRLIKQTQATAISLEIIRAAASIDGLFVDIKA